MRRCVFGGGGGRGLIEDFQYINQNLSFIVVIFEKSFACSFAVQWEQCISVARLFFINVINLDPLLDNL